MKVTNSLLLGFIVSNILLTSVLGNAQTQTQSKSQINPAKKSSVYGATIKHITNNGDGNAQSLIKKIVYPRPGEILFQSEKYCGDGDVAKYYIDNPYEDYAKGHSSTKLVVGYWVTKDKDPVTKVEVPVAEDQDTVPNYSNWFAIGYNDLPNNDSTKKLFMANSSTEAEASAVYMSEMSNLFTQIKSSSSKKTYNVYSAAMICTSFVETSGVKPAADSPTGSTIASNLITLMNNISTGTSSLSAKNLKADILVGKTNITFDLGKGTDISNSYLDVANVVEAASYPPQRTKTETSTDQNGKTITITIKLPYTVGDIRGVTSNFSASVRNLINICSTTLDSGGKIQYWWESLPLELTCQSLKPKNLLILLNQMEMEGQDSSSLSVISPDQFNSLKQLISNQLMQAAVLKHVQDALKINTSLTQNKVACFPKSGNYIYKIIASLGFPYVSDKKDSYVINDPKEMTHPEPLYALVDYVTYRDNVKAVFMSDKAMPMAVSGGKRHYIQNNFTLTFKFHVRDVGCSDGPIYCKNEGVYLGDH